jgi:small-conductance mechanosensitive channel
VEPSTPRAGRNVDGAGERLGFDTGNRRALHSAQPPENLRYRMSIFRAWRRECVRNNFRTLSLEGRGAQVISLVIGILITIVVGAILFWAIDRFCPDARLANLLKLLVILLCLASIVTRLLPLAGYPALL